MNSHTPRPHHKRAGGFLRRLAVRSACAVALALVLTQAMQSANARLPAGRPAGFWAGMAHGAVMPAAFPALILGRDVMIYAADNTGVPYKLGYTLGVNACGAVFFGLFYRRTRKQTAAG